MAALTPILVHSDGLAHRIVLYRVLNVTTLDTVDVGADFKKVVTASAVQASSALANFAITTAISGTVITLTAVGMANDGVFLLVAGSSA